MELDTALSNRKVHPNREDYYFLVPLMALWGCHLICASNAQQRKCSARVAKTSRIFVILGTGDKLPAEGDKYVYLGNVLDRHYMWHIYERRTDI